MSVPNSNVDDDARPSPSSPSSDLQGVLGGVKERAKIRQHLQQAREERLRLKEELEDARKEARKKSPKSAHELKQKHSSSSKSMKKAKKCQVFNVTEGEHLAELRTPSTHLAPTSPIHILNHRKTPNSTSPRIIKKQPSHQDSIHRLPSPTLTELPMRTLADIADVLNYITGNNTGTTLSSKPSIVSSPWGSLLRHGLKKGWKLSYAAVLVPEHIDSKIVVCSAPNYNNNLLSESHESLPRLGLSISDGNRLIDLCCDLGILSTPPSTCVTQNKIVNNKVLEQKVDSDSTFSFLSDKLLHATQLRFKGFPDQYEYEYGGCDVGSADADASDDMNSGYVWARGQQYVITNVTCESILGVHTGSLFPDEDSGSIGTRSDHMVCKSRNTVCASPRPSGLELVDVPNVVVKAFDDDPDADVYQYEPFVQILSSDFHPNDVVVNKRSVNKSNSSKSALPVAAFRSSLIRRLPLVLKPVPLGCQGSGGVVIVRIGSNQVNTSGVTGVGGISEGLLLCCFDFPTPSCFATALTMATIRVLTEKLYD